MLPVTSGGSTGGEGGDCPPSLDWGQTNFIARPKNTHICKPPFACQNVLKQSRISKFSGGRPPDPPLQGKGRGGEGRSTWAPPPLETSSESAPVGNLPVTYWRWLLPVILRILAVIDNLTLQQLSSQKWDR